MKVQGNGTRLPLLVLSDMRVFYGFSYSHLRYQVQSENMPRNSKYVDHRKFPLPKSLPGR